MGKKKEIKPNDFEHVEGTTHSAAKKGKKNQKDQSQQPKAETKSKPKKSQSGGESEEIKQDQSLQAILLADSFEKSFRPITWESPKCLLPLVNVPMIDYTMQFLIMNEVDEVIIFCSNYGHLVEAYIEKKKYSNHISVVFVKSNASTTGGALRELDGMGIIRSDPFVILHGDCVTNVNLKNIINYHKCKRKEDHNACITITLKPLSSSSYPYDKHSMTSKPVLSNLQPVYNDLVIVQDTSNDQIVFYDASLHHDQIKLPLEIIAEHPQLRFRNDLLDCHIDICSPEFILQISDNFDYENIRRDFLRNESTNWELGMHIFGYTLQNEYGARVLDFRSYHAISKDVISKWAYPFTPDYSFFLDDAKSFNIGKHNVYIETGAVVDKRAKLFRDVIVGTQSRIGKNVSLENSFIGKNCVIGDNCVIKDSHIWEGSVVEAGVTMNGAILCNNVVVKSGAVLHPGTVLSFHTVIDTNVEVPSNTRVTMKDKNKIFGENGTILISKTDNNDIHSDIQIVGNGGRGCSWNNKVYIYGEDENEIEDPYADDDTGSEDDGECDSNIQLKKSIDFIKSQNIGCVDEVKKRMQLWSVIPEPAAEDDDIEVVISRSLFSILLMRYIQEFSREEMNGWNDSNAMFTVNENAPQTMTNVDFTFITNIMDLVKTAHVEGHPAQNCLMEIKSFKFARNKSFSECLSGCVPALLARALAAAGATDENDENHPNFSQSNFLTFVKTFFSEDGWGFIILKALAHDLVDELAIIRCVETAALQNNRRKTLYPLFRMILQVLYDAEILSEEALTQWVAEREGELENVEDGEVIESSSRLSLFQEPQVQAFVTWLKEAEDDEDEDDEED